MSKHTNMLRFLTVTGAAASLAFAASGWSQQASPSATPAPDANTQPDGAVKPGFIPGVKQPEALKLERTQFDWGVISDQKPVDYDFTVVNTSEDTIKIQIGASCGCTVPKVDKNTLAPGESTTATARFNPKGRSGTQTKTLTITVTEPAQKYASQSIVLTSTVKALVLVDPPKVHMTEVDHRNGATQKITVTGRKEGFAVLGVESNNPDIVATFGDPVITDINGETVTTVEVAVEAGKGANIGDLTGQLTIKTNDDRVEPMPIMVMAQVVGTARANPGNAFLRVFTPSTPFNTQVRIDSRNGTTFKIRSIEVDARDDMSMATDIISGENGKYYMLTLSGITPATPGFVQGTLIVETDIDGGETLRIPFSGSIRNPTPAMNRPAASAAPVGTPVKGGSQSTGSFAPAK